MRRIAINCAKVVVSAVLVLGSTGCNAELKTLLIDQGIGFLSAITAAGTTSLIQQWFSTGTA